MGFEYHFSMAVDMSCRMRSMYILMSGGRRPFIKVS